MPAFPIPPPAQPTAKAPKDRSWSVGTILLVLGAFGLVVAGLIFVTRSWDDLGLTGRTLILLGVTVTIGALGVWVTRRPLRASAEAVWSVFLALLTLDFFAAHHEDLIGLRSLDYPGAYLVWGLILLAVSVAIAMWGRPHLKAVLVAPAVAGGVGIAMGGVGAGAIPGDVDFAWRAFIALVVSGLMALATRPAALAPMTLVARIVFAGFFVAAYASAVVEVVANPELSQLVGDGHGIAMVLMSIASVVVAWLVPVVRIPLTALGIAGASLLAIAPVTAGGTTGGAWSSVAVLAAVLAALGSNGRSDWMRGVRVGALPAIVGLVVVALELFSDVLETAGRVLDNPWSSSWHSRLDAPDVVDRAVWAVLIVAVALVVTAWFVSRWPELLPARSHTPLLLSAAVALGAADIVIASKAPVWGASSVLLALAVAGLVLHVRKIETSIGPVVLLVIVMASALAAASAGVSAVTWLVGALILAGYAYVDGVAWLRQTCAVGAVVLVTIAVMAAVELVGARDAATVLAVLITALVLLAAAGLLLSGHIVREAVEVTAGVAVCIALVTSGSSGELAVRWTLAGVALIAVSFGARDRRWYVWPGLSALVVAYILLIVDSGFSFVEAYTLPLGALALGAGLYWVGRMPQTSSWVLLGPGLAIALLPSVPQALAEPTELRSLLLGVGAFVVLAVGVRLRWQAAFVSGAVILALLVLFNIGPYANAAPRVVVIAVGSAILLGIGITWEDRVRDGRKVVAYVRSMR